MKFNQPVMDIIRARVSWRRYQKRFLDERNKKVMLDAMASLTKGLLGEKITFHFVEKQDQGITGENIGAYGLITDPSSFILGKIENGPKSHESYGYLLEMLALKATDVGLNTCWVGYFNRDFFCEIPIAENEVVPSILVIGYGSEKRNLIDRAVRVAISAHKRKSWGEIFFEKDFYIPLSPKTAGEYADSLEMTRLAPSSGNTQPWRVIKEGGKPVFHFYKVKTREGYEQRKLHNIDLGICMSHFDLTCREKGLAGSWQVSDPGIPLPPDTSYIFTWVTRD